MIKITIQGTDGAELGSFEAEKGKVITEMAQANNVEIPFSCGAGACGLCLCEVVEGRDLINDAFLNHAMMELEENQILTCISAIKDEVFEEEKDAEIILKRCV
ncbi:MAG TPA: 2Fe-2S iron-sulfur cluster binding domain-containing protein [Candidatus Absconditabacterales bacterium]|nr:2Fe-2S iron-sulfur cluster binding domain-containing protein [Candidatus Absconditabacterales bacterium]